MDLLGANPISLGNDGDFGQTMTQTGLEALMENELKMDMVMSRVDWIIKLREIFYGLLEANQTIENNKVLASTFLRKMISLRDQLNLMPRDEYASSDKCHEVCVSYGSIIQNLQKRIKDYQKEFQMMSSAMSRPKMSMTL